MPAQPRDLLLVGATGLADLAVTARSSSNCGAAAATSTRRLGPARTRLI